MILNVPCSQLRFSQPSINYKFRDGRSIESLIRALEADTDYVHRMQPLRIFKSGKNYVSLDNRRLACLIECSKFLNRVVEAPCILYRQNSILSRFGLTQKLKVMYFACSRHRGAFVKVRRGPVQMRRVIRVLKKTLGRPWARIFDGRTWMSQRPSGCKSSP